MAFKLHSLTVQSAARREICLQRCCVWCVFTSHLFPNMNKSKEHKKLYHEHVILTETSHPLHSI